MCSSFLEEHHHILSKLILIFFPFLCLPFLCLPFLFFFFSFFFFMYFLGIQTQKILIHKPKKFSHTQKKTFKPQHYLIKPIPLTSKSQTFLSLPKLSQLFQTPWPASSTHRHYRHHHNRQWFSSFLSLNDLCFLSRFLKPKPK